MLKICKNSNIVMTREPSGSNSDIIHKFKVYIPIIFFMKMIGIFGLFIHKLSKHMLTLNSESNIPELCCEQCCLQGDWKTNLFSCLSVTFFEHFPFTPVNNAWLGCRFRQVALLKVQAQLLIRHRGPRECIMGLTTELPQTVRQRARRFMSKSTLISEGKLNRMLLASFDAVILPLSVQLRHLWEWSATLIKDEDKGKVSLWEKRFQTQTCLKV